MQNTKKIDRFISIPLLKMGQCSLSVDLLASVSATGDGLLLSERAYD